MVEYSLTTNYERAGRVVATSFDTMVFQQWITYDRTFEEDVERVTARVKQVLEAGAQVAQAGDFSAVAVWLPPGFSCEQGFQGDRNHRVKEVVTKFSAAEEKYFKDKDHWELNFLARDPAKTTKGAISAVVKPFLEKAVKEGLPACLIAVNDHAKEVYEHFGFKVLETIELGVGEVNKDGVEDENGEGLRAYLMAYNYNEVV